MKQKFEKDYYIGLDMGTNSVGWAVTDEDYKIFRFNKKDMWGSRLFGNANSAKDRRIFRASRRRLKRRKWRINILKDFFYDEIKKIDESFFMRLDESNLYLEDKKTDQKFTLFNDKDFNDVDFHKRYDTIYHLRKELIESNEKKDIRLIYLAIHHIFKSRGHFLFENLGIDEIKNFDLLFFELKNYILDRFNINISEDIKDELKNILTSKDIKKYKKYKLKELFKNDDNSSFYESIFNFCLGDSLNLAKIFDLESLKGEKIDNFNNYEESKRDDIYSLIGEDILFIDILKKVNDFLILSNILKETNNISSAMVNLYNEHKEDLKNIKYIIKKYDAKKYNEIFRNKDAIYSKYIKLSKINGKKQVVNKFDNAKSISEVLKNQFKNLEKNIEKKDLELFEKVKERLEENKALPKLRTSMNSVIPYQLHKKELIDILENQSKHYEFLKECKDKIIKTFEFRIPYYVGPLNAHSQFAWIKKNSNEKILPWNFEDVVNIEESAEKFIEGMINFCTYLRTEHVMPKNSLVYEEFAVLNELNKVKINGNFLDKELKNKIFNELFKVRQNVSVRTLIDFLKIHQINVKKDEISGLLDKFNANYSTFIKFRNILGDKIEKDSYKEMIENIIKWKCLYGTDKKIFNNKFKSVYKNNELSDEEYKKILNLNFSGFGRLSKKFLTEIEVVDKTTGELYSSIMEALRETNYNLQELFKSSFDLMDKLEELDEKNIELIYEELREEAEFKKIIDNSYVSPLVKRSIIQTLKIINEIIAITKKDPKKIFVEVARESQESKVTVNRKEQIEKLYKEFKKSNEIDSLELEKLSNELELKDNNELRSKKIFLYFMQLGKCIYTGEKIDLNDLLFRDTYDIDHLYPQSFVKDDSIDNMVLTKKEINNKRQNTYPIKSEIQSKMKSFWTLLKSKKLMSNEKYDRLMDTREFSDDKLVGFIQRQLVSTRQSTLEVTRILSKLYPNSEIIYSKASNVNDFKSKHNIIKSRELNDLHHAKDAYLNIVVGNILDSKFTKNYYKFVKKEKVKGKIYNLKKIYDSTLISNGKVIWNDKEILERVLKTHSKNTANVTYMLTEDKGKLFNLTINKKGETTKDFKVPIDVENTLENIRKYGYYSSMEASYFVILEVEGKKGKKEKKEKIIDRVLVMDIDKLKNKEDIEKYFEKKYINPKYLAKIKKGQLIEYDGYPYRVSGFSGENTELKNAKPLFLDDKYVKTLINVSRLLEKNKSIKEDAPLILSKLKKENNNDKIETYEECVIRYNKEFMELYDKLLEKIQNKIYENYSNSIKLNNMLKENKKLFENVSLRNKAKILNKIIRAYGKATDCGSETIEGYKVKETRIKKSIKFNDFYLIDESITGLFNKKNKI